MPVIERRVTIQRPLFEVFRYISDFRNMPEWQPATLQVSVTAGNPTQVGTMVSLSRRSWLEFINADVVDYQVNQMISLKGVVGRFPFRRVYRFESSGRETVVSDRIELHTGCLYSWMGPLLSVSLGRQMTAELSTLAQLLEAGAK